MKKILITTTLLATFLYTPAFAEKIKKGVKVFVSLSPAGSFEITGKRFKGGKVTKKGDSFEVNEIYVPTNKLTTGIDLRDEHMRERLKSENVMVKSASGSGGSGKGIIIVRDVEKEFNFTYEVLNQKYIRATFELNLNDFKIPNLSYMGVGVEEIIKLEITLPYKS